VWRPEHAGRVGVSSSGGQRLAALHHKDFTLFWLSQISSNVGSWMQQVATGWLVLELTDSPAFLGLNALLQGLPLIIFALVGGVIADRFDRYKLVVVAQIAYLVPDVILAGLVTTGHVQVEHVFIYSSVTAVISGLSNPSRQSFVSSLVPREALLSALALNSMLWQGAAVAGPSLAGISLATWGLPASFNINVLSDVVSLGLLLLVRVPRTPREGRTTAGWSSVREGLTYSWQNPHVRMLLIGITVMTFLARPYTQLMPAFARDVFDVGPQGLGVMLTMPAIGTITSATLLAFAGRLPLVRTFLLASAALALALIGFSITRNFPLALALLIVIGGCTSASLTAINSRLQEIVADRVRGRVLSLYMACNQGSWRLGATPAGVLADLWGASAAVGLGAVLLLGGLVGLARNRTLWEAQSAEKDLSSGTPSASVPAELVEARRKLSS
jgi:MFS family permease